MLPHALARVATRRLAIHGVPFGCAECDVKYLGNLLRSKSHQKNLREFHFESKKIVM
jgi:hypothetical protein